MAEPRSRPLLSVRGLDVVYRSRKGGVHAVRGLDLDLYPGEVVGLIGESGCGKSATARAIMRMFVTPPLALSGELLFDGRDLMRLNEHELARVEGRDITMVSQDPASCLNPVFTVREQLGDAIRYSRAEVRTTSAQGDLAVSVLAEVGLLDGQRVLSSYPHQLSGGMRQRVLLAMALVNHPRLLIADEPTTALDVTVQAQILALIRKLAQTENLAVLFITHDLSVVAQLCDRVAVMYAGRVVETAPVQTIFGRALHPYTRALLALAADSARAGHLVDIPGAPPDLSQQLSGCAFYSRCPVRRAECEVRDPALEVVASGHSVACPPSIQTMRAERIDGSR